jgi:hypothetical protein
MRLRRPGALAPLLLGLLAAAPGLRAQAPSAPAPAALAALDRVLGRFAALLAQDDDARHRAAARATLGDLQRRREALGAAFDAARCEDLKAEAVLDLQREAAWVRSAPSAAPGK